MKKNTVGEERQPYPFDLQPSGRPDSRHNSIGADPVKPVIPENEVQESKDSPIQSDPNIMGPSGNEARTFELEPLPRSPRHANEKDDPSSLTDPTTLQLGKNESYLSSIHVSDDPSEDDYVDPAQFVRNGRRIKADPLAKPRTKKNPLLKPWVFIVVILTFIIIPMLGYLLFMSPESQERLSSPLTLNGTQISNAEFSFMYHYVLLENGINILEVGADKQLESPGDGGFSTYREYFLDMAAREIQVTQILFDDATANGYSITDAQKLRAQAYIDWLSGKAAEIGVDVDTYIKGYFGTYVTKELILDVLSKRYFTEDYASGPKLDQLKASETQAEESYAQSKKQYDIVSYRVLRIVFEQADESFKDTAQLRAKEIIDGIGHDPSKFEAVAANYFTGEAKEKILEPDSTLIKNVRHNDIKDPEWSAWLYSDERTPGDCTIFNDEKGFPILFCFTSRTRQTEPLRDVRFFYINKENLENSLPGIPENEIMPVAQTIFDSVTDEASFKTLETTYADEINEYKMKAAHNMNMYPGVLPENFDEWIFDPARVPGDKTMLETPTQIAVLFYVSSSENPEWFDRVNSFIRMNNYQAFILEKTTEYPYTFNDAGLTFIKDVPSVS
jgi:hypothetical protein